MNAYVYIYFDPNSHGEFLCSVGKFDIEPFYVGKGTGNRSEWILSSKSLQPLLASKMKIFNSNMQPTILKFECSSEVEAFKLEENLTRELGLIIEGNGPLRNLRHGGEGGFKLSDFTKQKLSEINTGALNPNFGKKWSDSQRDKFLNTYKNSIKTGKVTFSPERMKNTWTHLWREYKINDGHTDFLVNNLTKFCKEKNLPLSAFRSALKSDGVIKSSSKRKSRCEGWTIIRC